MYGSVDGLPVSDRPGSVRDHTLSPANPNIAAPLLFSRESFRNASFDGGSLSMPTSHAPSRQGSRGQFSRLRMRKASRDTSAGFAGDYVIHDFINEKTRSHVLEYEQQRMARGPIAEYLYTAKIYFVLVSMGIGAGLVAASLDLSVEWLSDIKFGYCSDGWYLTREMCCRLDEEGQRCGFREWSTALSFLPLIGSATSFLAFLAYGLLALTFGVTAAFLVKRFAPHAAGSGVPEIKTVLSGVVIRGYLSSWAFVIKVIGLAFSVASGLNLGKEGPFVHLVSVLANMVATSFDDFRDNFNLMMEFVCVGTAAGVSVAFNAPIGGVLFAFEEAASYFPNRVLWRSFFASALAELTLKVLNPFFNGKAVMFEVNHSLQWFWFEMIPFFVIGALGGILGSIFIHYNVKWSKLRIHDPFLKRSPIIEVAGIVLVTVMLQYPIPFLRLTNTEILATLFSECNESGTLGEGGESLMCDSTRVDKLFFVLFYAVGAKLLLTILTFGARLPAGLFIPSMTIGACAGRIIGTITKMTAAAHPDWAIFSECRSSSVCVQPSIYALVGASSTLAGVTQVSVSLVVIMFELTGGLSHLLPTMFGILAAKMVCTLSGLEGIYDMHINIKRYPFLDSKHHISHEVPARVIMRPPRVVIPEMGASLGHLQQLLNDYQYYGFPIVRREHDMILTGNIVRRELKAGIEKALRDPRVSYETMVSFKGEFDITDKDYIQRISANNEILLNFAGFRDRYLSQVGPETPLSDVYDCFSALGLRMCFVTRHGELLGLISKKDAIAYCDATGDIPRKFFR